MKNKEWNPPAGRTHSHAGFWAVLRAGLRLLPKGYRLNNLSMELWNQRVQLADLPWRVTRAIYVSEVLRRRVIYVFLTPLRPVTGSRRRCEIERRLDGEFRALGYRPQEDRSWEWQLGYEKTLDGKRDPVSSWIRLLRLAEARGRTLPATIQDLLRRGWEASTLTLHGPDLRFKGAGGWKVRSFIHWDKKEGIRLILELWPRRKIPRNRLDKDEATRRFIDGLSRDFKKQGHVDSQEYSSKRLGYPKLFVGLSFSRSRIPPAQVLRTLNRLQESKSTE